MDDCWTPLIGALNACLFAATTLMLAVAEYVRRRRRALSERPPPPRNIRRTTASEGIVDSEHDGPTGRNG